MPHRPRELQCCRFLPGLVLGVFTGAVWAGAQPAPPRLRFVDISAEAGIEVVHVSGSPVDKRYLFEAKGGGAAFLDLDNDGALDILFVQGSTVEAMRSGREPHSLLYRNLGGGRFRDVSAAAGITATGWGMGVACGDFDNDGWVDIFLTQLRENLLYRNNGDGTFTNVAKTAGVDRSRWSTSAAFGDYDNDGDLDLYVCNYVDLDFERLPEPGSESYCQYRGRPDLCGPMGLKPSANILYRNNGDGTFSDVTVESGVNEANLYYSLGVVWADLDNDGDIDLMVGNDSTPNSLYVNRGDGSFGESAFLSGLATNGEGGFQASMGVDAADVDNDGLLDVFMTHFANDYNTLYANRGGLLFEDVTGKSRMIQPAWLLVSWGTRLADFDLDGWKDIFFANGHVYPFLIEAGWSEQYRQSSSLFLNLRDGTFQDISSQAGADLQVPSVGRGVAFGDFDNDGDVDVLKANLGERPQLFRNDTTTDRHWVTVLARGVDSNRDALGARLSVETDGLVQVWEVKRTVGIYSSSDPRAHFGLGAADRIRKITVRWPGGKIDEFRDLPVDRHLVIDEAKGVVSK